MPGGELQDNAAQALCTIEKWRMEDGHTFFPIAGQRVEKGVIAFDHSERFILSVSRPNRRNPHKITYQLRTAGGEVLYRLDIGGPNHENPDGKVIPCPHLHIYKEGHGVSFAYPIPPAFLVNIADFFTLLGDFYQHCNITRPPYIERGLLL